MTGTCRRLFTGWTLAALTISAAAEESTLVVASLPDPVIVWAPDELAAQPDRQWPVLFWYPGTGGKPSVDYIRRHAGGKDWVIVGMGFRDPGRFQGDEAGIAAELAILRDVRGRLAEPMRLHPARAYVGGFSKGGWVSALFLARDPALAGALVMGAGILEAWPAAASQPLRAAYVGIGELDGNRAMSQRAAREFASCNAEVTLDVWDGLGHALPPESETLRQWLRLQSGAPRPKRSIVDPLEDEAIRWFDRDFGRITGEDGATALRDRYFDLEKMIHMPLFSHLDAESRAAARKKLAEWAARPELEPEIAAQRQFFAILDRESRDRLIGTLASCRDDYRRLAQSAQGTCFGAAAARAAERAAQLLK